MAESSLSDWIMVGVTIDYVIATVCIFIANNKSAKAAEKQLQQMKKQFEENDRPILEAEFLYSGSYFGIRFRNHGNHTAQKVAISLSDDFITSVESVDRFGVVKNLRTQLQREKVVGVHQHYDIILGKYDDYKRIEERIPATGRILYYYNDKAYKSDFYFDFDSYNPVYTIGSPDDALIKEISELSNQLRQMNMRSITKL